MDYIQPIRLHLRLYQGQDDDLIAWALAQDHLDHGAKTATLKAALRRGISGGGEGFRATSPSPVSVDLDAIAQVVEAAVARALAHVSIAAGSPPEANDQAESLLDTLGDALLLE